MTDSKLRELERRWRGTNSVEDHAAYLQERVRVGDLDERRLHLAAVLGDPSARIAVGESVVEDSRDVFREGVESGSLVEALVRALARCGREACMRAGVALSARSLRVWEERFGEDATLRSLVAATRTWLASPDSREQLERHIRTMTDVVTDTLNVRRAELRDAGDSYDTEGTAALAVADVLRVTGRLVTEDGDEADFTSPATVICVSGAAALGSRARPSAGGPRGTTWGSVHQLMLAVGELAPWALGVGDPLLDRPLHLGHEAQNGRTGDLSQT